MQDGIKQLSEAIEERAVVAYGQLWQESRQLTFPRSYYLGMFCGKKKVCKRFFIYLW